MESRKLLARNSLDAGPLSAIGYDMAKYISKVMCNAGLRCNVNDET